MSVDTFLRKEKDGSLYKASAPSFLSREKKLERRVKRQVKKLERVADDTLGLKARNLLQRRTLGNELVGKVKNEFDSLGLKLGEAHKDQIPGGLADDSEPKDFPADQIEKGVKVEREHTDDDSLAKEIAMDHLKEFPNYYDALDEMEKKLEAEKKAGASHKFVPIPPDMPNRSAISTLYGDGYGGMPKKLPKGATGLAAEYDRSYHLPKVQRYLEAKAGGDYSAAALKRMRQEFEAKKEAGALQRIGEVLTTPIPGTPPLFLGRSDPMLRTTGSRALDQRKLKKTANSGGTMQRMVGEGASRGPDHYIMEDPELRGIPATSKTKPGDAPTRDEAPEYRHASLEANNTNRSLDLAPKVASISADDDEFPTSEDGPEQDPVSSRRVEMFGYQHSSETPVPGYNPDWKKKAHVQRAMRDELQKLCCVKQAALVADSAGPAGSYQRALQATERLRELAEKKPTQEQVGRGAVAGALVGTGSTLANKLVSGDLYKTYAEAMHPEVAKGLKKVPLGLTQRVGRVGTGTLRLGKSMAGGAAGSAVFGAALPIVSGEINRRAEMNRLREYIAGNPRSRLRRAVSEYTGV